MIPEPAPFVPLKFIQAENQRVHGEWIQTSGPGKAAGARVSHWLIIQRIIDFVFVNAVRPDNQSRGADVVRMRSSRNFLASSWKRFRNREMSLDLLSNQIH